MKSNFVQSAPRPSEYPPVKTFMFYFILFYFSRARLLYPKAIDSSRPLLSQVTPGRHAPIDCSLPLYYKLFPMAVTHRASRFTGLGISLPISSIHGYVSLSLNGRFDSLGMQVSYQTYVCMHVCMVITYSRVWINRVRLPILLVVS